jgi:hypothetical protein
MFGHVRIGMKMDLDCLVTKRVMVNVTMEMAEQKKRKSLETACLIGFS